MYQRINQHDFIEAFRTMGRFNRQNGQGGNFTYEALAALFEYLEDYEDSVCDDSGLELDVIALCCEFAEYDSIEELAGEYDNAPTVSEILADLRLAAREVDDGLADELRTDLFEWFRDQTTVIEIPGTDRIIIQSF